MALTKAEDKMARALLRLSDQKDLIIPLCIEARQSNRVQDLLEFLDENEVEDIEEVVDFLFSNSV